MGRALVAQVRLNVLWRMGRIDLPSMRVGRLSTSWVAGLLFSSIPFPWFRAIAEVPGWLGRFQSAGELACHHLLSVSAPKAEHPMLYAPEAGKCNRFPTSAPSIRTVNRTR